MYLRYDSGMEQQISTIVIVEDDSDIRKRLAGVVDADPRFQIVGSADCLQDGMDCLKQTPPDVLLVDLGLPDGSGIELIRCARRLAKPSECMVITIHADQHHLMKALEAGATGYLLKDAMPDDICRTIDELIHGGSPISPLIARALLKRFGHTEPEGNIIEPLTDREMDVLKGMSLGMTRKEIARKLSVSVHTIHSHVKNIYGKLEVNSNIAALQKARHLQLIQDSDG